MNIAHWLEVIIMITLIEFALVIVCGLIGACLRAFYQCQAAARKLRKKKMRDTLLTLYSKQIPYAQGLFSASSGSIGVLLEVIEEFNKKFNGPLWVEYKHGWCAEYLLPLARKKVGKKKWKHRDFASRCFALMPLEEDEEAITALLQDTSSIIPMTVALGCAQLATDRSLHALACATAKMKRWGRYAYKDAFLQHRTKTFPWVLKQLEKESDPNLRAIYIDLLKDHWEEKYYVFLDKDFTSSHDPTRQAAADVLIHYPTKERHEQILAFLHDPLWEIRAAVTEQLPVIFGQSALPHLLRAFEDGEWWVRLKAALGIRRMGEKGVQALHELIRSSKGDQAELSKYVLALPHNA